MKKSIYLIITLTLLGSHYTYAFKGEGHKEIEVEAIKQLRVMQASPELLDGESIYQKLLAWNILSNDATIGSDRPDMDLARQFLSDRQIYHFMASSKYVMKAIKEGTLDEQKMALIKKALPECIHVMYLMIREILTNPVGSEQAGRGTYVLIHIVGDSYSREHTIRDPNTGELESIKSWSISKVFWPKKAKVEETPSLTGAQTKVFLHTAKGDADSEWKDEAGNFTKTGNEAVVAIKELLILLYQAMEDQDNAEAYIVDYFKKFFKPKGWNVDSDSFVLPGTSEVIRLSYLKEFQENRLSTIQYDRYPRHVHMFTMQPNRLWPSNIGMGYEYSFNFTPHAANKKFAIFRRLPYGLFAGAQENCYQFQELEIQETIQIRLGGKLGLYFPFANAVIEPRLGYSVLPLNPIKNHSILMGVDLSFTSFPDFFLRKGGAHNSFRFSLGYEYLTGIGPYKHNILLKIGLNTWQGRVINR